MAGDLVSRISAYADLVQCLPEYDDREEVIALFIAREAIADVLMGEEEWSAATLQQLERVDRVLVQHSRLILQRFRDVFELRPPDVPRRYWWWYLNEGPQVREQALAAARER